MAVSGNKERHPDTYCFAADKIEEKYSLPILIKFDKDGDSSVDAIIKAAL